MKENLEVIITIIGVIVKILIVGAILMIIIGALSLGFQVIWAMIPFGIAGLLLGLVVIGVTYFTSKRFFPNRKLTFNWTLLNQLEYLEVLGYFYGVCVILVAISWFFMPKPIVQAFPPMKEMLVFYIAIPFLIYGIGGCLQGAIKTWRNSLFAVFFFSGSAIFVFFLVNYVIWNITEKIPQSDYGLSKILFGFYVLLQLLYIIFFHIIPALNEPSISPKDNNVKIPEDITQ